MLFYHRGIQNLFGEGDNEVYRKHHTGINTSGEQVCALKFVDYQAIIEGAEILQHILTKINDTVTAFGMKINASKTEMMIAAYHS